jgi:hypothetical protein
MKRITEYRPGDLVTHYHVTKGELTARVVSVNCTKADIQPVEIADDYSEQPAGAVRTVLQASLCWVPDRQTQLDRGQTIRDRDLARLAALKSVFGRSYEPGIREFDSRPRADGRPWHPCREWRARSAHSPRRCCHPRNAD